MARHLYTQARSAVSIRRSQGRVAHWDPSLPGDLAEVLWNRPEDLVAMGKPLRVMGVRQTVQLSWASRLFVVKHYVEPSWRHAVKRMVLPSRARIAWAVSHRLADAGIATPRAVACVENRWGPLRRDSFLMYRYIDGRTLKSYFAGDEAAQPAALDGFWAQLCELWQQLGRLRVTLGDANLKNFIVSPTGKLWVIDLDKTRFHRLPFFADRHQRIRWKQVLRSASKC